MPSGGKREGAGKKKGSQHKDLKPLREKLTQLLESYSIEQMVKDLKSLEAPERLRIVTGLLEFELPKLARTEVKQDGDNKIVIEVVRTKRED